MTQEEVKNLEIDKKLLTPSKKEMSKHDENFSTKPITFFRESLLRFAKDKASIVAFFIIVFLILFALIAPIFNPYSISYSDPMYKRVRPKGFIFGDGTYALDGNKNTFYAKAAIGLGAEDTTGLKITSGEITFENSSTSQYSAVKSYKKYVRPDGTDGYEMKVDSYYEVGFVFQVFTVEEYDKIIAYQQETGRQIIYPMMAKPMEDDPNIWYETDSKLRPVLDSEGNLIPKYYTKDGQIQFYLSGGQDGSARNVRVLYYEYYRYKNGREPVHLLGTDNNGYDILARLCGGIKTSLLLSLFVTVSTFLIGAVIGSIEGFYGGMVDMITERIKDIIGGIPFLILATLFQLHLVATGIVSGFVSLLFAFMLTGWIGNSSLLRTQFYRFKNQEYVLAARTLGASDGRLMFRHIFPNSLGTVVTSCALDIPLIIMSESSLSYLGLIKIESSTMSSLGNMLASGQEYMLNSPHILLAPALVLGLLMISFNLFGNGLRDALNPTLRGA